MGKILVVSGHDDLKNNSAANAAILKILEKKLPDAEYDYLDSLYPDFKIDAAAEQAKLINSDIIVLQYPIYWYSMPALLKKWMEDVFTHGFSHGSKGDKLKGKKLIASFTSGAPEELYHKDSFMKHEISDYLAPLESACILTGMTFSGYVYTGNVSYDLRTNPKSMEGIVKASESHAERLISLISSC